jgi:hypothetical protein
MQPNKHFAKYFLLAVKSEVKNFLMQRNPHYELKAMMARKGLTLRRVAKAAGVEYCRASEILSGARIDPENLERLQFTINSEPLPALKGMPV